MSSNPARPTGGFTLLEVVVAVTIAGLAIVGLFQAGSAGLFAADSAGRVDEAIERAQSHLAAFGRAGAIRPGMIEGEDGGGYRWRLTARPIVTRQVTQDPREGGVATLYDIEAVISWRVWGRERSIALVTRQIGVAAAPQ